MKQFCGYFIWCSLAFSTIFLCASALAQIPIKPDRVTVGAEQLAQYEFLIKEKRIGLVVNQTSIAEGVPLPDFLLSRGFKVSAIFSPEHGFTTNKEAGEQISDDVYVTNGKNIPVFSLYGKTKKPQAEQLRNIDILLFDIQDVGARFYTYLSTLHYCMEAAAENRMPLVVLDRPNPNGHYVDGPVLEPNCHSFVGMHPIPVVHGCTLGELAMMINGERWLNRGMHCELHVVPCLTYDHHTLYELPVPPSPNLREMQAIYLYPSLCLFEGTAVSVGRGTEKPFTCYGFPGFRNPDFSFTPSIKAAVYPGINCGGRDLNKLEMDEIRKKGFSLNFLFDAYQNRSDSIVFFNSFFEKLAGTKSLRKQILSGMDEKSIRSSWQKKLNRYKSIRKKYLLYRDYIE
jgi:uncharacterized protein YbbC (DUF1343 family)